MKRQNPLMTTYGILSTGILLAILALILWRSGGMAFSPGRLSAISRPETVMEGYDSHAAFQQECRWCHQPLETTQDQLCLQCHKSIATEITTAKGTHGKITDVNRCATCHFDHRGPDFNPTRGAFEYFDHSATSFSLVWHQVDFDTTPLECLECHTDGAQFSTSLDQCAQCHAEQNLEFILRHNQEFGLDCTSCHDGLDRMTRFDHQTTAFPLEGRHHQATCGDCHGAEVRLAGSKSMQVTYDGLFTGTPSQCVACHAEPESHLGMFSTSCADCHNPQGWSPALLEGKPFEHAIHTGFSLAKHLDDYEGQRMICQDCHGGNLSDVFDVQTCIACHSAGEDRAAFMADHQKQFGPGCIACHDGVDRMSNFDHNKFFPLEAKHASAACEACHIDQVFAGTPKLCVECHAEPKIHAGFFGLKCQYCHTAEAWAPARLHVHDFPLDHGAEKDSDCQVCHSERYYEYTCYGCHEHQPAAIEKSHLEAGVSSEELPNCVRCHPTGLEAEAKVQQ